MYSAQVLGALLHGALCIMEWAVMNAIPSRTGLVGRMRMGRLQFIFSIFSNAWCPEKEDGNSYRRLSFLRNRSRSWNDYAGITSFSVIWEITREMIVAVPKTCS